MTPALEMLQLKKAIVKQNREIIERLERCEGAIASVIEVLEVAAQPKPEG